MSDIDITHAILIVIVIIIGTIIPRFLPLSIFSFSPIPPLLAWLSRKITPCIIGMLIVYSLKDINLSHSPFGSYEGLGVLSTIIIYLIFRRSSYGGLLAIFLSTIFYIALVNFKPFG
ncbi:AzlD domain-containing protein [Helicobacter sp. 11S02629-2]|uniref:AzlD domain-containing protein n=1 Tax=Helicobacter sp. 11S02629-2 TaxID=1476195 RepID=UPI000BD31CBE|nr:AzlD domain-containing protein [Helicobacter sp. 11S02629-2]PAF45600.1 hypothetical protein BKH40_01590 [Helicobacter sp. 11S02629-2]